MSGTFAFLRNKQILWLSGLGTFAGCVAFLKYKWGTSFQNIKTKPHFVSFFAEIECKEDNLRIP